MFFRPLYRDALRRAISRPTGAAPLRRGVSLALCLAVVTASAAGASASQLWAHKPASDIKWYSLTDVGSVLVGSKTSVYALDGESGAQLWSRDDLANVEEYEMSEIVGTPLVLVSRNAGNIKKSTAVVALDVLTGQTVWETERVTGSTVAVEPVPGRDLVLLLTVENNGAAKAKPRVTALRLTTGDLVWETDFPEAVDLYAAARKSRFFQKFDLSGANPPLFDGDAVYFTYAGLHRFSLADGALVWKVSYDVTEGAIKRGNAQAIVDGETIYTSAKGQLRAVDKTTGAVKWTSKDFGGAVAEMQLLGDVVYGRLGGAFYNYGSRKYEGKKPFGVAAVDKRTGERLWYYEGAKDSITNMLVLPELSTVLVADAKNLIALDTTSTGKVKEAYKIKLEFKHRLGVAGTAAKIAKFGLGGISAIGKGGADTTDEPVALYRRENGTVVVQGMQHLLAFDPRSRQIPWSVKYEAPGVPGWQTLVMAGLTAIAYTANASQAADSSMSYWQRDAANDRAVNSLVAFEQLAAKRYSAARATNSHVYVLTSMKVGEEKGAGIVGVRMETGESDRRIMFKDKEPDYEVDEYAGRVFNLRGERELAAFSFDAYAPTENETEGE